MSTKNDPGKYDCYAKLAPDEPYFLLRAKDPTGSHLVAVWVCLRAGDLHGAVLALLRADESWKQEVIEGRRTLLPYSAEKSMEAQQCAQAMLTWFESKLAGEFVGKIIEERMKGVACERTVEILRDVESLTEEQSRHLDGCTGCQKSVDVEMCCRVKQLQGALGLGEDRKSDG